MKRLLLMFVTVAMAAGLCGGCLARRGASQESVEPSLRLAGSEAFPAESPVAAVPSSPDVASDVRPGPTLAPAAVAAPAAAMSVPPADAVAYRIRAGDSMIITIRTLQTEQMEMQVDERGEIRLPFIGVVSVMGLTIGELENYIVKQYVDKQIYKVITAHVFVPTRSFFVRGEVRAPGRFPIMGSVSLLQAVATAGGYTDFADPKDVRITRGDKTIMINAKDAERYPEKDIPIEAGDVITIKRSWY